MHVRCSSENVKLSAEREVQLDARRKEVENSALRIKLGEVRCAIVDIDDLITAKRSHICNLTVDNSQLRGRKLY